MVTCSILLQHSHAREWNGVPARQEYRGDDTVGSRRGLTHEISQPIVLDNAEERLRSADRTHVHQEGGMGMNAGGLWLDLPVVPSIGRVLMVRPLDNRKAPSCASQSRIGEVCQYGG